LRSRVVRLRRRAIALSLLRCGRRRRCPPRLPAAPILRPCGLCWRGLCWRGLCWRVLAIAYRRRRRRRRQRLATILRLAWPPPILLGILLTATILSAAILPFIITPAVTAAPVLPCLAILLRIGAGIEHAEIMFRVLIIGLGGDTVARGNSIPRHGQIPFVDLVGIAPNATFGTATIKVVRP